MFGNINGYPFRDDDESKLKTDKFQHLIETACPDVLGICEHKRVMNRIRRDKQPQRMMDKWGGRVVTRFSWLQDDRSKGECTELGGTGIITMNKGSNHTVDFGEDRDKLGRWNWITINGKKDKKVTVVSIYRPRQSQETALRQSAILSKKRKIEALVNNTTTTWREDLREVVEKFQEKGHEIIIGGDFNDDLNDEKGEIRKFMKKLGLREVLVEAFGKGPATHGRGSMTIDGIFCSEGIQISNGGYVSYDDSPGDHRWPWIDVKAKDITGKNREEFIPPIDRRVTSKVPKIKKKFQDLLEEQVKKHKLKEKMEILTQQVKETGEMSFEQQVAYETIEVRFRRAVKYADRRCRKIRRGKTPFSTEVKAIMRKIRIQKLVKLRLLMKGKKGRPRMRKLQRYAKKNKYEGPLEFKDLKEANKYLAESYKEYRELRSKAKELRKRYIYEIAEDLARESENGRDTEWFANKLIREEEVKEHFREIKRAEKKNIRKGVEKVVATRNGVERIITKKEEIAEEIKRVNMAKRLQAESTPLRSEPLASLLGEQMDFDKWEEILHGQINLPEEGIEEGTRIWYDIMRIQEYENIKLDWTSDEYIDSWKKINENKSSMPGIQAAHIKSIEKGSDAAYVISQLALIPLVTGYAPVTWQEGIDSMIPKKIEGECRPDKLRLILLFDARFNHNNKLIGKKLMEFAEEKGLLAKEQFGSRKSKSAIDHAVNKRLTLDFSRQFRANCVYIANDAKSCYNRILLMVAYLMMRQTGLDEKAAISSISTLAGMEMKIRTAHGVSEVTYGGMDWEKWPHGIGQGNGYGPAIWAIISSPLLFLLREKGYGTSIETPITKEALRLSGFSFVDDTDQCEMAMDNKDWGDQLKDTQNSLDLWESLLRTTGGAIEPTKSDWTKMKYVWKKENTIMEKHKDEEKLYMKGPSGEREELRKIDPNQARETLGVWQAADGQEKTQTEKLISKIDDWGSKIKSSQISAKETTTAVKTTIGKTVRYPLAATAINERLAQEIDRKFRKETLGKLNIVKSAPVTALEAPIEYGGLGIANNVYKNQMIDHCLILMNHGHTDTITGKLLRVALEALAIESGFGGDPGLFDMEELTWVTENTWIGNTLAACNQHHLEVHTSIQGLKLWTNRDEYLMEVLAKKISRKEAKILNKVRMYLKVATFSDIATADGKEIDHNILKGEPSNSPSPSSQAYQWPNVDEPTKAEKRIWEEAICKQYKVTSSNRRLADEAILLWDKKDRELHQWSYSQTDDTIYKNTGEGYEIYKTMNIRQRRQAYFKEDERTQEINTDTIPISVGESKGAVYIQNKGRTAEIEDTTNNETGWILRQVSDTEEEREALAKEMKDGSATFVGDGSYKAGRSSSAVTAAPRKRLKIVNTVPGSKRDQCSYRAELAGILSTIVYANKLAKEKKITGAATMVCDNKGALNASFGWRRINPRWQSYDLLSMIRYHISISPLKWKQKHIKGHQDKKVPYEKLDLLAQANVDVDKLAKKELKENIEVQQNEILPGQSWKLYNAREKTWVAGSVEKELRAACYEQEMREIWERKCKGITISDEEWSNFQKLNKEHSDSDRQFLFKYGLDILPIKKNMKRRKHAQDSMCPGCQDEETSNHLLQCKGTKRKIIFKDEMDELEKELKKHTSKEMKDAILYLTQCFRDGEEPKPNEDWETQTQDAVVNQWERGQTAFFMGFWRDEWNQIQGKYHERLATRTHAATKIRFMIRGCQKLLKSIWNDRNEEIHRNESSQENKRKHEELNKHIKEIFQKKGKIPNTYLGQDAKIFKTDQERAKRMKIRRKERWVRTAQDILSKYERGNARKEAKLMRSYFMPVNYMHRDDG